MVSVLNQLGYNVFVHDYTSTCKLPNLPIKIIFGHSPNLERAAKKWPNAYVVMYATGCFYTHQNSQEKHIIDIVNRKYGVSLPQARWVPPYNAHILADKILLIGSKYTIETFPEETRGKITTIHQSSQMAHTISNIQYAPENEFFFMASSGNLLRGVPFLIDYFSSHRNKILNIVSNIEEYLEIVKNNLPTNIKLHGFININSDQMLSIMSRCNFIIYPSGSEGCPGSVINSMKNGLIPIVSKWAAFDEIDEYGYQMSGWSVDSITEGVKWSESLSVTECCDLKQRCADFANRQYNIDVFSQEFKAFFKSIPL